MSFYVTGIKRVKVYPLPRNVSGDFCKFTQITLIPVGFVIK